MNGGTSDKQTLFSESSGNNMILIVEFKQLRPLLRGGLAPLTSRDKDLAGQSPGVECSQLACLCTTDCQPGTHAQITKKVNSGVNTEGI